MPDNLRITAKLSNGFITGTITGIPEGPAAAKIGTAILDTISTHCTVISVTCDTLPEPDILPGEAAPRS